MEKYFTDKSLLRLHPKKPTITKSKSVSFSLAIPDIPSTNDPSSPTLFSLSEIPESTLETYTTRDTRLRLQPTKDYRVSISKSKISASRTTTV